MNALLRLFAALLLMTAPWASNANAATLQQDINHTVEHFLHEGVLQLGNVAFQGQQAFPAGHMAPLRHPVDEPFVINNGGAKHPEDRLHAPHKHGQGALDQNRAPGATADDEEGRGLEQGAQMAAFQDLAPNNGGNTQQQADDTDEIHVISASCQF